MIVTALSFAGIFLLSITPGLLLCLRKRANAGELAAMATASLVVTMLVTACLGVLTNHLFGAQLPAWTLAPVSLILSLGTVLISRPHKVEWPDIEWQAICAAAIFLAYGALTYHVAVMRAVDGSMLVHAWYNADWFKHVAHVNGLANFGVPARDIFGNAGPLHYYWLSYLLPGAATAIGSDAWTAIYLANLSYAALMMISFYGLVRATGATATLSAVAALLATMVTGRIEAWTFLLTPGGVRTLLASPIAPPEPALASLVLYIPQHALALSLLLGWALIALGDKAGDKGMRWLSRVALAAVMTVSTLFGAMLLGIYGLTELLRRRLKAVVELAAMAVCSVSLVALLGVIKLSDPTSSVASRVDAPPVDAPLTLLASAGNASGALAMALGLSLLVAIYAFWTIRAETKMLRGLRLFSVALIVVPFLFLPMVAVAAGSSIAYEVFMRGLNPPAIAFGILGGWAIASASGHYRTLWVTICGALVVIGLPGAAFRQMWHGQLGDPFTTVIPADDLAVLASLRASSRPEIIVWQFPEEGFLAEPPGRDLWAPVFAGRAVVTSARATDQRAVAGDLALAKRFFLNQQVPIPARADAVYLSQALHPESYAALMSTMKADPLWVEVHCRSSACVFFRREGASLSAATLPAVNPVRPIHGF